MTLYTRYLYPYTLWRHAPRRTVPILGQCVTVLHHLHPYHVINHHKVKAQVRQSVGIKGHIQRLEEQNAEDRIRIQRLVALSQPVTNDITILLPEGAPGGGTATSDEEETTTTTPSAASASGFGLAATEQGMDPDWVEKAIKVESDENVVQLLKSIQQMEKVRRRRSGDPRATRGGN